MDDSSTCSPSQAAPAAGSEGIGAIKNDRRRRMRRPSTAALGLISLLLAGLIVALVCVFTIRDNKDEKSLIGTDPPAPTTSTSTSARPTLKPTEEPITTSPTIIAPGSSPTKAPVRATNRPTLVPSFRPTASPTRSPSTSAPTTSEQEEISSSPQRPERGETMQLPKNIRSVNLAGSYDGEIMLLEMVLGQKAVAGRASGAVTNANDDELIRIPAGRSYEGRDWEAVAPTYLPYECSHISVLVDGTKSHCRVDLPSMYDNDLVMHYTVRSIVVDAASTPTAEEEAARFLIQTTFGPTRTEIADFVDNNLSPEQWMRAQMDEKKKPTTLHRAHYRRRANQRLRPGAGIGSTDTFGIRSPCDAGSRWNRFAFTDLDVGKKIEAEIISEESVLLKIDGRPRTEVPSHSLPEEVIICRVEEYVGGEIVVGAKNAENLCRKESTGIISNPAIKFSDEVAGKYKISAATLDDVEPKIVDTGLLKIPIEVGGDGLCPLSGPGPFFVRASNSLDQSQDLQGSIYIHDPRGQLFDATPGSGDVVPQHALASSIQECPRIPKTFLNEGSCQPMRGECSGNTYGTGKRITLNDETIRRFYELDGRYVYVVKGLPVEDTSSPCVHVKGKQRWVRYSAGNDEEGCPSGESDLPADVLTVLQADIRAELLRRDSSSRASVVAIDVAHKVRCNDNGAAVGSTIRVGNLGCWTHSNPGEYGVYDASWWVFSHPGNSPRHRRSLTNPIAHVAEAERKNVTESVTLTFPSWHPSERWKHWLWAPKELGGYGDVVDFARLPREVQGPVMARHLGAVSAGDADDAFEFCGSPGEVANDPRTGAQYGLYDEADMAKVDSFSLDQDHELEEGKAMVWASVVMSAKDQLRQRVAFALSQIFVVSSNGLDKLRKQTEPFAAYYDIFTRNAFGLFGDILKEVSFSPMMGEYLSYLGGKSFGHNYEELGLHLYADENFAREIMQLFTIGLWMLHENGTQVLDENGNAVPTYSNKDIMTLARGWTGFNTQEARTNLEASGSLRRQGQNNDIDPMRISSKEGRDAFPKLGLDYGNGEDRRYIGDDLPLCSSLPAKAFLAEGATYRFLGSSPNPTMSRPDLPFHSRHGKSPRLALNPESSSLYKALCNAADSSESSKCRFQSIVVLDKNLECDGTCLPTPLGGDQETCECSIDEPRVVRLDPSSATGSKLPIYYEYVRSPCATMAFESGEDSFSVVKEIGSFGSAMCAPKDLPVAGTACCDDEGSIQAESVCVFLSERVSFYTASDRCKAIGKSVCKWNTLPANARCGTKGGKWEGLQFQWTNSPCRVRAAVNPEGDVAVIHDVSSQNGPAMGRVSEAGATYFRVEWEGSGNYPLASRGCSPSCTVSGTNCLCDVEVNNKSVHIGDGKFSFRNPPMFGTNLIDPSQRDGLYETDAILKHLLHHPNVAPFIATRLIQLLITSNPSPRYVQSVAHAFKTGRFFESHQSSNKFGSGRYGDMEAVVAAIFLDPEARSTALAVDRTHGRAREPLLKVMHFLRSMELGADEERQIHLPELRSKIGQEAHYSPSVFNFFMPSFQPIGPVLASNLVSPESQLLDPPQVLSFINGITSVTKYGLADCGYGFGSENERFKLKDRPYEEFFACGSMKQVPYQLNWKPSQWGDAGKVVQELDIVLTGGRLSPTSRHVIERVYSDTLSSVGRIEALGRAQAMLALSAEYHSTNAINDNINSAPTKSRDEISGNIASVAVARQQDEPQASDYKAVVYLFAAGGMDSHSILVPLDGCMPTDLHHQYKKIRNNIALSRKDLLSIDVAPGAQPCTQFGIHSSLTTVKKLFEEGDATFIANVGNLITPLTKIEYDGNDSDKIPPSLFAHNTQQRATQTLQAQNARAHGVLGRLGDALNAQAREDNNDVSEAFSAYSISGSPKALEGAPGVSRVADVLSSKGITGLSIVSRKIESAIKAVHAPRSSSIYAETFSDRVTSSIARAKELGAKLKRRGLVNGSWHLPADSPSCCTSDICMQLQQVAQIIMNRDTLEAKRDAFFVQQDGYDTHNNNLPRLQSLLDDLDEALNCFAEELKAQGVWDKTAIVLASDFGRSLPSNGLGTDHGWAGNYFVVGGAVNGGQVLGEYPNDLTEHSPYNVERGRILPTVPWDAVWAAVAEWMGLNENRISKLLPNLSNFDREKLFSRSDLFVQ